tara:strand:- start:3959 stop:4066 length:108 start_codon:yes stop_codon:yes gene_type:complete
MNKSYLKKIVKEYGGKQARNFFENLLQEGSLKYDS